MWPDMDFQVRHSDSDFLNTQNCAPAPSALQISMIFIPRMSPILVSSKMPINRGKHANYGKKIQLPQTKQLQLMAKNWNILALITALSP